jgi:hypothetical protein
MTVPDGTSTCLQDLDAAELIPAASIGLALICPLRPRAVGSPTEPNRTGGLNGSPSLLKLPDNLSKRPSTHRVWRPRAISILISLNWLERVEGADPERTLKTKEWTEIQYGNLDGERWDTPHISM